MVSRTRAIGDRPRAARRGRFLMTASCCLACTVSVAQQSPPGAAPEAPWGSNPLKSGVGVVQLLSRKSVVFPDLATDKNRLSGWEKFKLAANNSVSISTTSSALVGAAFGQAINNPSGYGQGGAGYGKRLGSSLARSA